MKKILVILPLLLCGLLSQANVKAKALSQDDDCGWINMAPDSPSSEYIEDTENKLLPIMQTMNGINGFGESLCDEATGVQYTKLADATRSSAQLVRCIVIFTADQKADDAVESLMPTGHKVYSTVFIIHHQVNPQP